MQQQKMKEKLTYKWLPRFLALTIEKWMGLDAPRWVIEAFNESNWRYIGEHFSIGDELTHLVFYCTSSIEDLLLLARFKRNLFHVKCFLDYRQFTNIQSDKSVILILKLFMLVSSLRAWISSLYLDNQLRSDHIYNGWDISFLLTFSRVH